MKKAFLLLALVLVFGQTSMTVMAHGHGHKSGCYTAQAPTYSLCNVEGCCITEVHQHDNTYYCGHSLGDGHDYHEVCSVEGCTETTEHEHDGTTCLPHSSNDGHSYHGSHNSGRRHHH